MTATGYIGGDPTKVDIDGWTLGDVLAANAAGELEAVPIGTPAEVLTVDAAEPTDVGWSPGGGGGSAVAFRQSRISSGSVAFPNTGGLWVALPTLNAPLMPAAVGDYVEISPTFLVESDANAFIDLAVQAGGSLVRFFGSGTASPLPAGNPGLYPIDPSFRGFFGPQGFVVEAGDLDGGNVQVVVAVDANGFGSMLANANFPFQWIVKNFGPVT